MSSASDAEGCQIILVNTAGSVLLQLRDDNPSISFPDMWAIPGGMLESGESASACVEREVYEELGVTLPAGSIRFISSARRFYGIEHTFTAPLHIDIRDVVLTEGQRVDWFSRRETAAMQLAYEDNAVLEDFFERHSDITPSAMKP